MRSEGEERPLTINTYISISISLWGAETAGNSQGEDNL